MIKVIKRDGREKGFEFDRIETAVNNAYLEVYGDKVESFVHEIGDILNMIFKDISSKNDEAITIEEIQDIVVKNLLIYMCKLKKYYNCNKILFQLFYIKYAPSCSVKDIFFLHVFERKMLHTRGAALFIFGVNFFIVKS